MAMKSALCEKHGVQQFVTTSPSLVVAIERGKLIEATDIKKLKIESTGRKSEHFVDSEFLKKFQIESNELTITFKDRDKASNQLNDRLIIQKIVAGMKWACPVCLYNLVAK